MRLVVKQIKKVALTMLIVLVVITPAIDVLAATGEALMVATAGELEVGSTEEDTANDELEEALERNEFLANSYKQLEEKYQREKDFSRSVIYVLIFVIAVLIVLLVNVIALSFRKVDDDFEDSFKKKKTPKQVSKPAHKTVEKPAAKAVETKKQEPKKEPAQRAAKPAPKPEKPAPKAEVRRNFEVFDFNDED